MSFRLKSLNILIKLFLKYFATCQVFTWQYYCCSYPLSLGRDVLKISVQALAPYGRLWTLIMCSVRTLMNIDYVLHTDVFKHWQCAPYGRFWTLIMCSVRTFLSIDYVLRTDVDEHWLYAVRTSLNIDYVLRTDVFEHWLCTPYGRWWTLAMFSVRTLMNIDYVLPTDVYQNLWANTDGKRRLAVWCFRSVSKASTDRPLHTLTAEFRWDLVLMCGIWPIAHRL